MTRRKHVFARTQPFRQVDDRESFFAVGMALVKLGSQRLQHLLSRRRQLAGPRDGGFRLEPAGGAKLQQVPGLQRVPQS